ncbi:MAG: hypothetical protein K940chlam5_00366 [Candidatus Anoxychlamydiales bacterium]|nr:hypothetical protein [Candidatus Anoxychlamydiales bacterium]
MSSTSIEYLTSIPPGILHNVNRFLELPGQNSLSETCNRIHSVVKSNFAALEELKYLEKNMVSLDGTKFVFEELNDAVQKQEFARELESTSEHQLFIFLKNQEAKDSALKLGIDIADGSSVAYKYLIKIITKVYENTRDLTFSGTELPKFSYADTIRLQKKYLFKLYKALRSYPNFKADYEELFQTRLPALESIDDFNNPMIEEFITMLHNRIKLLVIKYCLNKLSHRLPEQLKYFNSLLNDTDDFNNQSCIKIVSKFHNFIKFLIFVNSRFSNESLYEITDSFNIANIPEAFFHIWKKEFFDLFLNGMPKNDLFNYLTQVRSDGLTLLQKTAMMLERGNVARGLVVLMKHDNPQFIRFLLEKLDEDKRFDALQVVVDRKGTAIFQKILSSTKNINLIKIIMETVFKDPKDRANYIKENIEAFNLRLPSDLDIKNWIDTLFRQEIERDFSNMNDNNLLFYLSFYLACKDGKSLIYILNKISDPKKRTLLILNLFKDNKGKESFYGFNKVINKQDLIRILKLLPDNASKAEFLLFTGYYLIIGNEERTTILRKEIAAGNFQYFEGLVKHGSLNNIVECVDTIPEEELKPMILYSFNLDKLNQTHKVIKFLMSKLKKEEQIAFITHRIFSTREIVKLNLYKLLYDLNILYDCLLTTHVQEQGGIYSLMHCLFNLPNNLKKGGIDLKQTLSNIFETFKGKDRSEIIDKLKTRVERSPKHPTIYAKLIIMYPESKARLEEMFPGIDKEMDPTRKRSEEIDDEYEIDRSAGDSKKRRIEGPEDK